MPPAPKTIDQIGSAFANEHVNRLYGQTSHKSDTKKNQFYRTTHISDEFAYSVFASQRCIDLIEKHYREEERKYTMDATFKIVPRLFYQLLIIYFETPSKQVQFSFLNLIQSINSIVKVINCFVRIQQFYHFVLPTCFFIFPIKIDISIYFRADDSKNGRLLSAYF